MTTTLDLGGVRLPLDAITQTFGILAVRGAGKSNTAASMAEEMFGAGLPFVVVDPVGSWFGLRSAANGKGPGLGIPIFGGEHGDVPLEKTGGSLVADLVVEQRLSLILDVSEFSKGDRIRFLTDFAERLYKRNRDPLHLFLEEADDFIPQKPFREEARCLAAWETIVRRGRGRGLGITMITQRSAALNKNVLTQTETLIVLRITSPQDRKAIAAWVEYQGQARELLESLSSLENGEAWFWSPHWLKKVVRTQIRRRNTFDSGATPKNVRGGRPPATLADVDLGAIQTQMAATIERAKADDPKQLRAQIAELRTVVKRLEAAKPTPVVAATAERIEVPVLSGDSLAAIERSVERGFELAKALQAAGSNIWAEAKAAMEAARMVGTRTRVPATAPITPITPGRMSVEAIRRHVDRSLAPVRDRIPGLVSPRSGGSVPKGERAILAAISQCDGATREYLTIATGYKRSSRDTYLQRLSAAGLVAFSGDGTLALTDEGVEALGPDFEPLPQGDALREYWFGRLPEGERRILAEVAESYPDPIDRSALGQAAGYKRSSRDTYLQRLGARRLINVLPGGQVVASEVLFG